MHWQGLWWQVIFQMRPIVIQPPLFWLYDVIIIWCMCYQLCHQKLPKCQHITFSRLWTFSNVHYCSTSYYLPLESKVNMLIFISRIGTIYPNVSSDFDIADCPSFWRNRTVKINLMNLKDGDYPKNLKITAFIAIGLDLFVGICFTVLVLRYIPKKEEYQTSSGFGKFRFILTKFILLFAMPLIDTCTSEKKLFSIFCVQVEPFNGLQRSVFNYKT